MRLDHFRRALTALTMIVGIALLACNDASAAAVGETCGGLAGVTCDRGLWCDPRRGFCSGADIQGSCVRVPEVCAMVYQPVCGCNKMTYGNDCERRRAKVAKSHDGPCK
jgi:Kazal-type serine protease inhibitor domain